ncbi:MAG: RluA family pseudouridine synthase [Dehalococcoidales bacterium]|nr:RluA family pseudouridine synthase [Dehalococcoidales bacterium]
MTEEYSLVAEAGGLRLDRFIAENCPGLSRTHARELIEKGLVTVNGRKAKPGLRLSPGSRVVVTVPPEPASELKPEPIPLKVVYEDDDLIVVDKPPGLPVHPAPGHPSGTLVNVILNYLPQLADEGRTLRPGIVHRLDKDTSGLMVVAKNRVAHEKLAVQFKTRTVHKSYLVLVRGRLTPERGIIEAAIGRDRRFRKRMAVVAGGREASTEYRVVKYLGAYTLLEIMPRTGRTHQIRVHLAAIGFPVVGDATYGVASPHVPRQFLHASRLGFCLPSSGRYVEFTSPLPPDLARALELIG